jgi:hypothetical protein
MFPYQLSAKAVQSIARTLIGGHTAGSTRKDWNHVKVGGLNPHAMSALRSYKSVNDSPPLLFIIIVDVIIIYIYMDL